MAMATRNTAEVRRLMKAGEIDKAVEAGRAANLSATDIDEIAYEYPEYRDRYLAVPNPDGPGPIPTSLATLTSAEATFNRPPDAQDGFTGDEVVNRIVKLLNGGEATKAVALGRAWPLSEKQIEAVTAKRPEFGTLYGNLPKTGAMPKSGNLP